MRSQKLRSSAALTLGALVVVVGCAAAETNPLGGSGDDTGGNGQGGSGDSPGDGGAGDTGGSAGTATSGAGGTGTRSPSIGLPYTDDFETSNAEDWRLITAGSWAVTDDGGNNVYQLQSSTSDEETIWTVGGDRNWTDYRFELRFKFVTDTEDGMLFVGARWTTIKDYTWVEYPSVGKPKVRRKTNGSTADIVTTPDELTAGAGTWHTLALTLKGGAATLELDGAVLGTGTDSAPLLRGGIAIAAADCVVAIDDVSVTEAP